MAASNRNKVVLLENYDRHMSYGKIYMTLFGLWPATYQGFKKSLYEFYHYFTFAYFCLFVLTQGIEAFISLKTSLEDFAAATGVTIAYTICIFKVFIFKSPRFISIIHQIEKMERKVVSLNDESVKIYKDNVKFSKKIELALLLMGFTGLIFYYLGPVVRDRMEFRNATVLSERHLIVASWFPFDENFHYWKAYAIQFVGCIYGTAFVVYCQAFYLTMLTFTVGQFKIIQHRFINFSSIKDKVNTEDEENKFLKKIIRDHQSVIMMVDNMNKCMKTLTLLDFGISSFQLAMVVYQVLNVSGSERIAVFLFFFVLNIQLYLLYWHGNEITFQSEQVAVSVYQSEWNRYAISTAKLMQIVMLRAQKPVVLSIGPIGKVQLNVLFKIYKAIYSYLCLVMK